MSFCRKRSFVFVRIQNILQSKQKESRNPWGPHLRNDKNKNIREHFDSKGIHISI